MKMLFLAAAIATLLNFTSFEVVADGLTISASNMANDQRLIKSARQAAPYKVGRGATIVTMNEDGTMRTIREGNNGFTCIPDNQGTPGRDPMCLDSNAFAWLNALMAHVEPDSGKTGLIYMLAGGSDASNTDPFLTQPSPGNHWVKTGPHVMTIGNELGFYDLYPKDAVPDTSVPYVMWAGTPYQHLMIPVKVK